MRINRQGRKLLFILCILTVYFIGSMFFPNNTQHHVVPKQLDDEDPFILDQNIHKSEIQLHQTLAIPETTSLDPRCHESGGCFQGFSDHVNFNKEFSDAIEGGPMDYLPQYKNPCWHANVSEGPDNPYKRNPYSNDPTADLVEPWRMLAKKRSQGHTIRTRCLPLVFLIGVTKSGTTDLYDSIVRHTSMAKPSMKEPMWWNRYTIGIDPTGAGFSDYVDLYDSAATIIEARVDSKSQEHNLLTIDGTPANLWDYDGWEKIKGNQGCTEPRYILAHSIKKLVPNAKIVVILRQPTERLFSQFRMRKPTASVQEFHKRVDQAVDAFRDCLLNNTLRHCSYKGDYRYEKSELFLRASIYSVYLADWFNVFPKEQILVLKAEEYYANRRASLEQVFTFLNLEPLDDNTWAILMAAKVKNSKKAFDWRLQDNMMNSTREILDTFFQPYNEQLSDLLQDKRFLWK